MKYLICNGMAEYSDVENVTIGFTPQLRGFVLDAVKRMQGLEGFPYLTVHAPCHVEAHSGCGIDIGDEWEQTTKGNIPKPMSLDTRNLVIYPDGRFQFYVTEKHDAGEVWTPFLTLEDL